MSDNFFTMIKDKLALSLDNNQVKAASHIKGPALVLAVPGAGKTTVLITRIAYLVLQKNVPPSQILSITFSRSSAIDMKNRFEKIYSDFNINPKFSTIHSFAFMVLKDYFAKNGLNYNLLEGSKNSNQSIILREIYKNENCGYLSDDKLEELINSIGYIKNMMIPAESYDGSSLSNFNTIFDRYEEYKNDHKLLDFDDMLTMCLDVLTKDKNILEKYKNRYRYIQVDEGQDTSNIQHRIIELLAAPENNIFIVADDDQSIYGFRGANPQYLLDFKDRFKNASIFYMDTNYRSTKSIVSISDKFISQNKSRYVKNLKANNISESVINTSVFKTQEEQYNYIVEQISREKLSSNAILFRNNLSAIPLIDKLDRMGLDYRIKEIKLSFFNHWITSDIAAFFNLMINDRDKNAFEKIYYKMNAFISKKAMNFVMNSKDNDSVFKILQNFDDLKSFQKKNLRNLGIKFNRNSKNNPSEILNYIECDLDYLSYLEKRAEFLGQSLDNAMIYLSTIKLLASRTTSILDFLHRLEELKSLIIENSRDSGIFLSTIHSAKGLEFDNVFIVDLINGEFPSSSSMELYRKGELTSLEEERRVFYVGITRSKENLHLLSFKDRGVNLVPPSDFLNYLNPKLTESKDSDTVRIGSRIKHKSFGEGDIAALDDHYIMIRFDKYGVKSFSREIIKNKNLLQNI